MAASIEIGFATLCSIAICVSILLGSTAEVEAAKAEPICNRNTDCDFIITCNPGAFKLCNYGKCICIGGNPLHANEDPIKEIGPKVCSRDMDCEFLINCNPGGLKLCNNGECVCIGGHRPHANEAPNSAMALKEAGVNACFRDIDCDFLIKCNPGGLKLCDHGKCICVGGKNSPPASA